MKIIEGIHGRIILLPLPQTSLRLQQAEAAVRLDTGLRSSVDLWKRRLLTGLNWLYQGSKDTIIGAKCYQRLPC